MKNRVEFRDPVQPRLFEVLGFAPQPHSIFFHGLTAEQIDDAAKQMREQAERLDGVGLKPEALDKRIDHFTLNANAHKGAYEREQTRWAQLQDLLREWTIVQKNPLVTSDQKDQFRSKIRKMREDLMESLREGVITNSGLGILSANHSAELPASVKDAQNV